MRQAGRVLPAYQQLRQSYTFAQLMANPNLAAQVTMMPVDDLGVDAAIVFSDILTVPVAMGMQLEWTERGPQFVNNLVNQPEPLRNLKPNYSHFDATCQALSIAAAKQQVPVIGFCGAPLTTLCYMLQGNSAKHDFPLAKQYFITHPKQTAQLIDALTEVSIIYAKRQIESGASAFQLFETHAGIIPATDYARIFLPAVERIATAVREYGVPFIFFPKGIGAGLSLITPNMCDYVGIDWQTPLSIARKLVHKNVGLQGNIDPWLLFAPTEQIAKVMDERYKPFFSNNRNWIINLGHGVLADTPIENLRFLTHWIKETKWL